MEGFIEVIAKGLELSEKGKAVLDALNDTSLYDATTILSGVIMTLAETCEIDYHMLMDSVVRKCKEMNDLI